MSQNRLDSTFKDSASIVAPSLLLVVLGFVVAYQFVDPAPPDSFVMSTGPAGGAYHRFARRYQSILADHGIQMELRESAGSIQNLERLRSADGRVQVAFVQGGTGTTEKRQALVSLASVYFEPLWVFLRDSVPVARITDLVSRRIAIGAPGSGTRAVASQLLEANGVTDASAELLPLGGIEAAQALLSGTIDAVFAVGAADTVIPQELLTGDGVRLLSFDRAEAYSRTHRYLSVLTLPRGMMDLVNDRPPRDTVLLAPTANLVARASLHPALVDLLMMAAEQVHREGGIFEDFGQFPSPKFLEYPQSEEARRYFDSGPSFLRRVLPFWAATLVERMLVMLLPLLALLIPMLRVMPPVYRWRIRSRIYRWYRELLSIDPIVHGALDADRVEEGRRELARIEDEVAKVRVPLSYADQLYALRVHIELVRRKLDDAAEGAR